jgi:hypothetical protein
MQVKTIINQRCINIEMCLLTFRHGNLMADTGCNELIQKI